MEYSPNTSFIVLSPRAFASWVLVIDGTQMYQCSLTLEPTLCSEGTDHKIALLLPLTLP